jgi:hypothetical protein
MYRLPFITFFAFGSIFMIAFSGCKEDFFDKPAQEARTNQPDILTGREGIGDFTDYPNGERVAYPAIIERTFIPSNSLFANHKCLAWKITWPTYPASIDPEKIPTVFRTSNGALNSIYYLNNTHPKTTLVANFSLYHNNKLESAVTMWEELDYTDLSMEPVYFYKTSYSAEIIEGWVKERPQLFAVNWVSSVTSEVQYQAGDIYLFKLVNKGLYGGIRIVSMTPRVIEVYLAVPNV